MSVREIEKNKRYQIEIPLGYKGSKKIRHYETFYGTKKDAMIEEYRIKIQLKEGSYVKKTDMTFEDLSKEYLKIQKGILSLKTYINYEHRMITINEHLGFIKLKDLNTKVIENFYDYMRKEYVSVRGKHISSTTVQHYYSIINNMLEQAVRWDYLTHNPNLRIAKPKRTRANIQCYSPEEVDKLLEVLKNEPLKYQAVIQLALDLGCRRGELLGLTWDDIDFKTGKVVINKSLQYAYGKTYEKETKTENSNRVNFISNNTIAVLKKYQKEQMERKMLLGSKWINTNRVFTADNGDNMHPDTPTKILDQIIANYKLKRITFHGLRHTNISLMISKGVQSQIISRKVGHSSVQITDKIYSHFFEDEFKAVANVMDEVLSGVN